MSKKKRYHKARGRKKVVAMVTVILGNLQVKTNEEYDQMIAYFNKSLFLKIH